MYEYELLKPGQFTLEQHLNYVGIGAKASDGPVDQKRNFSAACIRRGDVAPTT